MQALVAALTADDGVDLLGQFTSGLAGAGGDFDKVSDEIKEKLTEYVDSLSVAQPFYLCEAGDIIFHTEGVKKYNFLQPYTSDVYPEIDEYCLVESICTDII